MEEQRANMDTHRFAFHGSIGGYYPVFFKNFFLRIITFGVYGSWAVTNDRKYFTSNSELAGGRYDYHGTGLEIFIGRLKALGLLILMFVLLAILITVFTSGYPPGQAPVKAMLIPLLIFYGLLFPLIAIAIIGTIKYRLSRTSWNNIRHNSTADWREFVPLFIKGLLLTIITLGIYGPFFTIKVSQYLYSSAWLGNKQFNFDGEGKDYFFICIKGFLLGIITLGIYWFWFKAQSSNYFFRHTTLDGVRFNLGVTGGDIFALVVPNILIIIFTLGFGLPIVMQRIMEFIANNLSLDGSFDPQSVEQGDIDLVDATGEGLGSMLELDL